MRWGASQAYAVVVVHCGSYMNAKIELNKTAHNQRTGSSAGARICRPRTHQLHVGPASTSPATPLLRLDACRSSVVALVPHGSYEKQNWSSGARHISASKHERDSAHTMPQATSNAPRPRAYTPRDPVVGFGSVPGLFCGLHASCANPLCLCDFGQ